MIPLFLLQFLAQNTINDFKILYNHLDNKKKCDLIRPQRRQGHFVFGTQTWLFKCFSTCVPTPTGSVEACPSALAPDAAAAAAAMPSPSVSTRRSSAEGDVDFFC